MKTPLLFMLTIWSGMSPLFAAVPELSATECDAIIAAANQAVHQHVRAEPEDRKSTRISEKFWGEAVSKLKPLRVVMDRMNTMIVLSEKDGDEEGLYVTNPISSYAPGHDGRFTTFETVREQGHEISGTLYHYRIAAAAREKISPPILEKIEAMIKKAPVTTNYLADLFELTPGSRSEYRLRPDIVSIPLPASENPGLETPQGKVFHLPAGNKFYIQWDGLGASTLHYYGPFYGNPAEVLKLTAKREPAASDAESPVETVRGDPTNEVSASLQVEKTAWQSGETPVLHASIINNGTTGIHSSRNDHYLHQIEVNGTWYRPFEKRRYEKPETNGNDTSLPMNVGELTPLPPGGQWQDIRVPLEKGKWQKARAGDLDLSRYFSGGMIIDSEGDIPIMLLFPGKYTIRMAFVVESGSLHFRVISNPVELEILPPSGEPAALPKLNGASSKGLRLECRPIAEKFATDQLVSISCRVTNTTNELKPVGWSVNGGAHFCLESKARLYQGGLLPGTAPSLDGALTVRDGYPPFSMKILYLPPGKSVEINLNCGYFEKLQRFEGRIVYDPLFSRNGFGQPRDDGKPPWVDELVSSDDFSVEVVAPANKPVSPFVFDPVSERVIRNIGKDCWALNLASGKVVSGTAESPLDFRVGAEDNLRKAGIAIYQPLYTNAGFLVKALDMLVVPLDAGGWELTAEQVHGLLKKAGESWNLVKADAWVDSHKTAFAFRTRDGAEGVLQVPETAPFTLRYKLVRPENK